MRLDKYLAHNNFGTRKEVRQIIKNKRVKVNGEITSDAGMLLKLNVDQILVDDVAIEYVENVYYIMNKPRNYECTHEPSTYPSVLELLPNNHKDLFFVGRLDVDTEGLLLITNDGQFSHRIAHGKKDIYKTYYVELQDNFDVSFINELESGLPFEEGFLKPAKVKILGTHSILLSIGEGKYHQVKRMMHYCNNEVQYLKRVKIGLLELDETLKPGDFRVLTEEEISLF